MPVSLIYARSQNHCIGKGGHIPWRLPNDFKHFKVTTMGSAVIMGRKTYEDHCCAFPGRLNIVVSRNPDYQVVENVHLVSSLEAAFELATQQGYKHQFVIGGVSFFEAALAKATTVYETVVDTDINDGDAYLSVFDFSDWHTQRLSSQAVDDQHAYSFTVLQHSRTAAD